MHHVHTVHRNEIEIDHEKTPEEGEQDRQIERGR